MLVPRLLTRAVALVGLSSCGGSEPKNTVGGCEETGELVVLAASSLASVFTETEEGFLRSQECVADVRFSFGSSATLAAQIVNGAPVDVFVSASTATMDSVTSANVANGTPVVFAKNVAALLVSEESRVAESLSSLVDLIDRGDTNVKVGLCAPSVPCGALADKVLENATRAYGEPMLSRTVVADTEASSAEDLVTKVRLGELDAGLSYASDCLKGTGVRCIDIPVDVSGAPVNSSTSLVAVAVSPSANARAFVDYLTSRDVQSKLVDDFGFREP